MPNPISSSLIDQAIKRHRVLIICGTGGVGKTTLSAAIAVRAAMLGKKSVVITIDPAKRLATSLGVKSLTDHPVDLTATLQSETQIEIKGTLSAVIPDTRKTFELLVRSLARTPTDAENVLKNPIVKVLGREFTGANEYMALERLDGLLQGGSFDTIILDTPPHQNVLAFLEAPETLLKFFNERLIRWFVVPTHKIFATPVSKALGVLERLTGAGFISNLFDFARAIFDIEETFLGKLNRMMTFLKSDDVGFFLVTTPTPETRPQIESLAQNLRVRDCHFSGILLNRSVGWFTIRPEEWTRAQELKTQGQPETLYGLRIVEHLKQKEDQMTITDFPVLKIPEFGRDIHCLEDLIHVSESFQRHN